MSLHSAGDDSRISVTLDSLAKATVTALLALTSLPLPCCRCTDSEVDPALSSDGRGSMLRGRPLPEAVAERLLRSLSALPD